MGQTGQVHGAARCQAAGSSGCPEERKAITPFQQLPPLGPGPYCVLALKSPLCAPLLNSGHPVGT